MKRAVLAIGIALLALLGFWAFRSEERAREGDGPPAGAARGASGARSRSFPGSSGGSHAAAKSGASSAASGDDPYAEERTPPLAHPATASDGFVEARASSHDKPVASAEVRLYARLRVTPGVGEQPWRVAGIARTDSKGLARIAARPGAYLVAVRAAGFAPARKEFVRASGEPVTRVDLVLGAGLALSGRTVAKGNHEPIALAEVTVVEMAGGGERGPARRGGFRARQRPGTTIEEAVPVEERSTATSDQDGRFRVAGLEAGGYRVEARATGTARAVAAPVTVPGDGDLLLELPAASFIEGQVFDADGKGAVGAEVMATGGTGITRTETTESGTFSLEVEPRTYSLTARFHDEAGKADDPVSVASGQTARGVKIRLGKGASLAGSVVARASTAPIPGALVNLSPAGAGGSVGMTTTDASGNFLLGGLAQGQYDVDVSADGYSPDERRGLVLLEGQRFPLQIALKANGTLQGVVHDLAGKTVIGALVRASPQFGNPIAEARTDPTGAYQLASLPAGRLQIAAMRDGAVLGSRQFADIPEGGVAHLDLTLAEEGLLTGRVTRKGGAPVLDGSVTVQITPAGGGRFAGMGDFGSIPVDPDGTYRASVPAGSYRISAGVMGQAVRVPSGNAVYATVDPGQTVARDLVADDPSDPQNGLSGTVLEPGGAPSAGATVMVQGTSGQRMISVASADENGRFQIGRARSDLPDLLDLTAVNGGRMGKVSVGAGQTEATVPLQPAASLRGRVVSAARVDGFSMTVSIKQSGRFPFFGGGAGGMQRQLQFAGDQFVADDLPATDVQVHVTTSDGRTGDAVASLVSGQAYPLDIPLQDGGNVLGRIVDENGLPVPSAFVTLDRTPTLGGDERVSAADGRFRLTDVPPGSHSYTAFAQGFRATTANFSLQAGQALDLGDVRLQRTTTPPGNVGVGIGGSDAAVQVSFVNPDGPAARAGMQVGDQLVQIDGKPVASMADARARLPGDPGSMVSVTYLRNGGSPRVVAIQRQPAT